MCDIWIRAWIVVYPWLAFWRGAFGECVTYGWKGVLVGAQGALECENRAGCGGGDHGLNEDRTFRLQFGANRAINAGFVACG